MLPDIFSITTIPGASDELLLCSRLACNAHLYLLVIEDCLEVPF